jgi:lysophospholipase L1-like esterase
MPSIRTGIGIQKSLRKSWTQQKNKDIVEAGGYLAIGTTGVFSSDVAGRSFLDTNNLTKIRQNGNITKIKFFTATISGNSSLYFQVWRKNGANYDLIGEEDVLDRVALNTINLITLNTPVSVLVGDYLAIASIGTSDPILEAVHSTTNNSFRYYNSSTRPTGNGFDWDGKQTITNYLFPIKIYMEAPHIVMIGDSIIAGHPGHYSYIEDSLTDSKLNCIAGQLYLLDNTYFIQNMGIGSQTSSMILSRFLNDAISIAPKVVIIEGGVVDIVNGGITKATFIANYTAMLNYCVSAGIIPIVCKIIPWKSGTNVQLQTRDNWMTDLQALVANYSNAIWVDFDSIMGDFRAGGDANNLWDLKALYDCGDGIHPNIAGYAVMASVLYTKLRSIKKVQTSKPIIVSASVEDTQRATVIVNFSIELDGNPDVSAFALIGKTISNYTISGKIGTFIVDSNYLPTDVITLTYTKPILNSLKALNGGGEVNSFNQLVTNNIISVIVMSDLFTGVTIDSNKWAEANPNSVLSQNDQLIITLPHDSVKAEFTNYLKSSLSIASGVAVLQGYLTWTTNSAAEARGGIYLYKSDAINAKIVSGWDTGQFRLMINSPGGNYDVGSGIQKGKDVKIWTDGSNIKFYYWNGSSWVQMGTTQSLNIGYPAKAVITCFDHTVFTGANPVNIDNLYLSNKDYITHYPI